MVKAAFTFLQPLGLLGQVSQRRLAQRDAKLGQNGSLTSHSGRAEPLSHWDTSVVKLLC